MSTDARLILAVQRATRKLSSTGNFNLLMQDVLAICVEAVGASGGTIYLHDPAASRLRFQHVLPEGVRDKLPMLDMADDYGMAGSAFQNRATVLRTFPEKPPSEWTDFEKSTGVQLRTMIATPLMIEGEPPIGVVQLINKVDGIFTESDAYVLDIVSSVSTMAYLNFQLTEESTRASTLLGMGKVGHDIGNLAAALFANVNFCELAMEGFHAHLRKQAVDPQINHYLDLIEPTFDDLKFSVERIVGYSRLISDMSAGRPLRPTKRLASMSGPVLSSAAYLETEARSNHVALRYDIDETAPTTMFDELYVFRIVQNLVGNAIKAVKEILTDEQLAQVRHDLDDETGFSEVWVRYKFDGSHHLIEVSDCGAGMTQQTIRKILSGNAKSEWDKQGGSGWGTKIVLELAATHDGEVSIDSTLGEGTTFRILMPHAPGC
jgi:signal transduction histidine kinase